MDSANTKAAHLRRVDASAYLKSRWGLDYAPPNACQARMYRWFSSHVLRGTFPAVLHRRPRRLGRCEDCAACVEHFGTPTPAGRLKKRRDTTKVMLGAWSLQQGLATNNVVRSQPNSNRPFRLGVLQQSQGIKNE